MNERTHWAAPIHTTTRRQMLTRATIALGALAAGSKIFAQTSLQAPDTAAHKTRTSLHQEIDLKAAPQRLYETLLSSKQFTAFTGLPAEIDPKAGGVFSMFSGQIVGRNVELVPGQRIVQAWRPTHWDAGVYSMVKFDLKPRGSETTVILDHTGFPEGEFESLSSGWQEHYWEPLKKFFV
jgi:activator of HSP90 ATPase